ncbi:hypothetical protein [Streptomyces pseudovenezuelae]|uniref:Uncharacterized protein n=1 Tax=Streptomyces pseudovenezuelae TaxID=67350 RepID=A0ABT6LXC5_9ACTN|nr:hypothetical protein [Streptomyces pseudovenezuelae]MDH6220376.1 hypothetical protein [Streptomyces pseudovenezuelae]
MTTPVKRAKPSATLGDVRHVPWHDIKDATGSAAAIPFLLAAIASGDPAAATSGLDRLQNRICQYGFVVGQATAVTVPFLWDLAQRPQVTCRVQILHLLRNIAGARQWGTTADAYPKLRRHRDNYVEWESAARRAVRADGGAIPRLLTERDTALVHATEELAGALAE